MSFLKELEKTFATQVAESSVQNFSDFKTIEKCNIPTGLGRLEYISLLFLIELYSGRYIIQDKVIFLYIEKDVFYFNLTDKERFGVFTIFHKNKFGNPGYHVQCSARTILYAFFICFTHNFNVENNIKNTTEDFVRFKTDCLKRLNN